MPEINRDAVSLSRSPTPETPRHLLGTRGKQQRAEELTDLKVLARRVLDRRNSGVPEDVSGVAVVSGVSASSSPLSDEEEERAASIEFDGGAPRAWAEALARLDPRRVPRDVSPKRWLCFIDDCGHFLNEGWAGRADALGWGPLELFGSDRDKPFARLDRAGLLWLLNGGKLIALTAATATIETIGGARQTYRRGPIEVDAVALAWELAP